MLSPLRPRHKYVKSHRIEGCLQSTGAPALNDQVTSLAKRCRVRLSIGKGSRCSDIRVFFKHFSAMDMAVSAPSYAAPEDAGLCYFFSHCSFEDTLSSSHSIVLHVWSYLQSFRCSLLFLDFGTAVLAHTSTKPWQKEVPETCRKPLSETEGQTYLAKKLVYLGCNDLMGQVHA